MAKILFATTSEGVKFYPVTITDAVVHIKGNTQKKLSEILDEIDYSGKADKVTGAVAGNFAGLDANGNLTDSGVKAADFKTKQTAVADPTADGTGVSFIDSISQNANGEIEATKKTVQAASASQAGLESAAHFEKVEGIEAGAQVNVLEGVKVNGTALTPDANKTVDVLIAEGDGNGQIKVNGTNIDVHGLGSAAFTDSTAYDAAGAAATAEQNAKDYADAKKEEVIGTAEDTASDDTIKGAKAYADSLVVGGVIFKDTISSNAELPTTGYKQGWEYAVDTDGVYAGKSLQAGDYLIAKKDYEAGDVAADVWAVKQGTVAVQNAGASLVIGTATQIATVEGVNITVTQVEDMTKIEAVPVADTTEYPDVTSLFTAPAGA